MSIEEILWQIYGHLTITVDKGRVTLWKGKEIT
jgi:hypothetical protein